MNDTGLKLRLTLYQAEFGLEKVYSRLAHLPNENIRARAIRSLLPMLLETGRIPNWFLAISPQQGSLPRSMTIRVTLPGRDPSLVSVNAQLRQLGDSARSVWIKNLMAKSLGLQTDSTSPAATPPSPAPAAYSAALTAATPASTEDTQSHSVDPADDQVRKKAYRNALKAFDLTLTKQTDH